MQEKAKNDMQAQTQELRRAHAAELANAAAEHAKKLAQRDNQALKERDELERLRIQTTEEWGRKVTDAEERLQAAQEELQKEQRQAARVSDEWQQKHAALIDEARLVEEAFRDSQGRLEAQAEASADAALQELRQLHAVELARAHAEHGNLLAQKDNQAMKERDELEHLRLQAIEECNRKVAYTENRLSAAQEELGNERERAAKAVTDWQERHSILVEEARAAQEHLAIEIAANSDTNVALQELRKTHAAEIDRAEAEHRQLRVKEREELEKLKLHADQEWRQTVVDAESMLQAATEELNRERDGAAEVVDEWRRRHEDTVHEANAAMDDLRQERIEVQAQASEALEELRRNHAIELGQAAAEHSRALAQSDMQALQDRDEVDQRAKLAQEELQRRTLDNESLLQDARAELDKQQASAAQAIEEWRMRHGQAVEAAQQALQNRDEADQQRKMTEDAHAELQRQQACAAQAVEEWRRRHGNAVEEAQQALERLREAEEAHGAAADSQEESALKLQQLKRQHAEELHCVAQDHGRQLELRDQQSQREREQLEQQRLHAEQEWRAKIADTENALQRAREQLGQDNERAVNSAIEWKQRYVAAADEAQRAHEEASDRLEQQLAAAEREAEQADRGSGELQRLREAHAAELGRAIAEHGRALAQRDVQALRERDELERTKLQADVEWRKKMADSEKALTLAQEELEQERQNAAQAITDREKRHEAVITEAQSGSDGHIQNKHDTGQFSSDALQMLRDEHVEELRHIQIQHDEVQSSNNDALQRLHDEHVDELTTIQSKYDKAAAEAQSSSDALQRLRAEHAEELKAIENQYDDLLAEQELHFSQPTHAAINDWAEAEDLLSKSQKDYKIEFARLEIRAQAALEELSQERELAQQAQTDHAAALAKALERPIGSERRLREANQRPVGSASALGPVGSASRPVGSERRLREANQRPVGSDMLAHSVSDIDAIDREARQRVKELELQRWEVEDAWRTKMSATEADLQKAQRELEQQHDQLEDAMSAQARALSQMRTTHAEEMSEMASRYVEALEQRDADIEQVQREAEGESHSFTTMQSNQHLDTAAAEKVWQKKYSLLGSRLESVRKELQHEKANAAAAGCEAQQLLEEVRSQLNDEQGKAAAALVKTKVGSQRQLADAQEQLQHEEQTAEAARASSESLQRKQEAAATALADAQIKCQVLENEQAVTAAELANYEEAMRQLGEQKSGMDQDREQKLVDLEAKLKMTQEELSQEQNNAAKAHARELTTLLQQRQLRSQQQQLHQQLQQQRRQQQQRGGSDSGASLAGSPVGSNEAKQQEQHPLEMPILSIEDQQQAALEEELWRERDELERRHAAAEAAWDVKLKQSAQEMQNYREEIRQERQRVIRAQANSELATGELREAHANELARRDRDYAATRLVDRSETAQAHALASSDVRRERESWQARLSQAEQDHAFELGRRDRDLANMKFAESREMEKAHTLAVETEKCVRMELEQQLEKVDQEWQQRLVEAEFHCTANQELVEKADAEKKNCEVAVSDLKRAKLEYAQCKADKDLEVAKIKKQVREVERRQLDIDEQWRRRLAHSQEDVKAAREELRNERDSAVRAHADGERAVLRTIEGFWRAQLDTAVCM